MKTILQKLYFNYILNGKTILYHEKNKEGKIINNFKIYQKFLKLGYTRNPFNY